MGEIFFFFCIYVFLYHMEFFFFFFNEYMLRFQSRKSISAKLMLLLGLCAFQFLLFSVFEQSNYFKMGKGHFVHEGPGGEAQGP